jgi:hypothetical protein
MADIFPNPNSNNPTMLNLESLTKNYDTLLIQYNQVQNDYINYLQQNPSIIQQGKTNLNLVNVPNSTFWGATTLSTSNASTVDKCSALCSNTPSCTGATFNVTNNTQNNCFLSGGDGMVIGGSATQYAIIPKAKQYLITLETLNSQLISTNSQIIQFFQTNKSVFASQDNERVQKYNLLKENYAKLEEQRLEILNKLLDYQTIEEKQHEGELIVKKNYYNYVLLLFIALLCFLILSKTVINSVSQNGSTNNKSGYYTLLIVLIILLLFVVISYFYRRFR